jgi:sorting nexin-25
LRKSKASLQREINRKELQRQQYIMQESDNSLYGRASISIKSIMIGADEDGREFAMCKKPLGRSARLTSADIIEVTRQAGEQMPAAAWVVTRRYSEFHELNKRLRARYPQVKALEFPRRHMPMLKLQKDLLEKRRVLLEKYLGALLQVPAICRSRELRAFLSQQSLRPATAATGPAGVEVDSKDFVTRIYNSVTDGMEEFLGNIPVLDQLSLAGQHLISAAATQLQATGGTAATPHPAGARAADAEVAASAEAEAELAALGAAARDGGDLNVQQLEPFVKPICDLFLEVFELNRENNWLRGRAVVLVLQQLLGGTVERRVRDAARGLLSDEEGVARSLGWAAEAVWPGGGARAQPPARSAAEKGRSAREAGVVLAGLVPDLVGSVVGRSNAQAAARRMMAMMNNERLK